MFVVYVSPNYVLVTIQFVRLKMVTVNICLKSKQIQRISLS